MKVIATILFSIVLYSQCFAQVELSYYLPDDITYDSQIPTPKQVVGHEVGEWHITHDRLVYFMRALSEQSDRVTLIETGKTHEERPQLLLTITSPENHAKIDEIRTEHKKLTDPSVSDQLDLSTMPVVVWQGYGIHGDEASGSNASMLTAYHYAAAQGEAIDELLENTIILLDPSFNPDGLTRFSTWVNSRKSKNQVTDPNNQEQNQFWPRGRTNHYWFDLNRDWLPVQQPESQNRVVQFHAWKPNVLTDHHEMGTNSTFFFQPGIPSRNNPNTPSNTIRLTEEMAKYHSAALDKIGSLYYAKESFDDFYYGKGSTFPDINGAVGILFEQASARSHAQESDHGILTFPFAIRNQFVTSLSTTEAALALREDLLQHQRDFFKSAINTAQKDSKKGIIFGSVDKSAAKELAHIMDQHEIEVYEVEKATSVQGYTYSPGSAYYVPLNQPQYKLIRIMFDKVTSFQDSLFYDVSAWTLPLAFNQQYTYLDVKQSNTISRGNRVSFDIENSLVEKSEYAYVFEWDDYYAPKMLASLLSNGIRAKVSAQPFAYKNRNFDYGSIMIPVQNQTMDAQQIYDLMVEMQKKTGIDVYSVPTGWTSGINLGSPQIRNVRKPSIALLVEEGVSAYDAGEVWHLLDNRFDLNVSLIPIRVLNKIQLERYNTIIMVNGSYGSIASS
ncbi:MAG: zinc carboxypeptidase, partial [Cyclobacteriaceae bacterium]|nr:zinc carboxypeptidase [Cyclobacteriaceae bacterium HetDA_MAG_MS6]